MTIVPGWYADPEVGAATGPDSATGGGVASDPTAGTLRWWDGHRWTEHTTTRTALLPAAPHRPPLGRRFFELAGLLQGVIVLAAVIQAAALAAYVWTERRLSAWLADPEQIDLAEGQLIDQLGWMSALLLIAAFLAVGVLFILWLFRAHRSDRMHAACLRHASGWAIGGWFVPVLNLWRPLQVVEDVRRGAVGSEPTRGGGLVIAWWLAFMASWVTGRVAGGLYFRADTSAEDAVEQLHQVAVADIVDAGVTLVALTLAFLVVRHVTGLLRAATPA